MHLFEKFLGLSQGCGDDALGYFEELEEHRLADRVEDVRASLAGLDEVCTTHETELLREVRCLDADFRDEFADWPLTVSEDLKDADPCRVAERLEELGLHLVDGSRHLCGSSSR